MSNRANQSDVDFIINDVMKGKELSEIEREFIFEDFPKGTRFMLSDCYVFEVCQITNVGQMVIKPIGINLNSKIKFDRENKKVIYRFIEDGKIVEKEG